VRPERWGGSAMTVMPMFPLGSRALSQHAAHAENLRRALPKAARRPHGCRHPEFGVVGISRGLEVGGGDGRMSIGTIASVTEIGTTGEFSGSRVVWHAAVSR
jgi:uncharacterized protein